MKRILIFLALIAAVLFAATFNSTVSAQAGTDTETPVAPSATLETPPPPTAEVWFVPSGDETFCSWTQTTVTAVAQVRLVGLDEAVLQLAFHVVEPADLATPIVYQNTLVHDGDQISISGTWPGVRPGDEIVEVHFGAMLLDLNGNPLLEWGAGRDIYWGPWVDCGFTPTETQTPTSTVTPTETATSTSTVTGTPPATETVTPTVTGTVVTVTVTASSTPTRTKTPGEEKEESTVTPQPPPVTGAGGRGFWEELWLFLKSLFGG